MRAWLPVLVWMGVIFVASTNLGSAEHTSRFIRPLVLFFHPGAGEALLNQVHFLVRKGGHVAEYAVLGWLVFRALLRQFAAAGRRIRIPLAAWVVCSAYAASDEFHQSFVSSRTAAVSDVLIDSSGAALTIALLAAFSYRARREA